MCFENLAQNIYGFLWFLFCSCLFTTCYIPFTYVVSEVSHVINFPWNDSKYIYTFFHLRYSHHIEQLTPLICKLCNWYTIRTFEDNMIYVLKRWFYFSSKLSGMPFVRKLPCHIHLSNFENWGNWRSGIRHLHGRWRSRLILELRWLYFWCEPKSYNMNFSYLHSLSIILLCLSRQTTFAL